MFCCFSTIFLFNFAHLHVLMQRLKSSAAYRPLGGALGLIQHICVCVCVCVVQFQSGGDPKTGAVVSAQEAQAQAILQQTKVYKSSLSLILINMYKLNVKLLQFVCVCECVSLSDSFLLLLLPHFPSSSF